MAHGFEIGQVRMSGEHRLDGRLGRELAVGIDWARIGANVSGPLLTLAVAILFDVLTRHGIAISTPFPLLLFLVAVSVVVGGTRPGLVSALLVTLYALHFLSGVGRFFVYTPADRRSLVLVALTSFGLVVLLGAVRQLPGARRRSRAGVAPTRPERVLSEAAALLASSHEYETTLQTVAKLAVPALADWCLVHVLDERGAVGFAASMHRAPNREVALHALRRYPPRELRGTGGIAGLAGGIGTPPAPLLLHELDAEALAAFAQDEDHLKRLQALGPVSLIVAPMVARGRLLGAMTFAMAESARHFEESDLAAALQLATYGALTVDNARIQREADDAERRYRLLFENNPQPMWVFDVESLAFLAVNDAAVRHYGYARDEFLAMTLMDIRPDEDAAARLHPPERPAPGREQVAVTRHQRKDGSVIDVELISHEVPFGPGRARLVQITDITERTRTRAALHQSEEQLRHAQRLDAAGRLANGVAHDFNNLLTAIQGYSELLLRDLEVDDPRRREIGEIRRAADRGALLTRQLLAFGRRPAVQPKALEVDEVVRGLETLLQRLVGADVQLELALAGDVGRVRIDPSQIEQVVINLALNARDAMPHGGTLTIETGERRLVASARSRQLRPGRYVMLAVRDSGVGMDADTQAHLFQPFFTTKQAGAGVGLGLSIVYGIVRQYGGVVRVASEPGQGTTVKVYLPLLEEPEREPPAAPEPEALRGLETVLLVEDEEAVRELLRKVLTRQGYTVLEARHGKDALLAVERHQGPLHLVVTDIVMPEMGGRELVEHLVADRPELRVLLISGYTNDEIIRRGISEADYDFIQKPFSSDDFVRKVREVLDAEPLTQAARS